MFFFYSQFSLSVRVCHGRADLTLVKMSVFIYNYLNSNTSAQCKNNIHSISISKSDIFVIVYFQLLAASYMLFKVKNNVLVSVSFNIKVFTADSLIKTVSCRHLMAE